MLKQLPMLLAALSLLTPLAAGAMDEETAGRLEAEMEEKREAIRKEYGNRKDSELSPAERREQGQKLNNANREVLDKNGISDKDYARSVARMGRGSSQAIDSSKKAHQEKRQKEKDEAAKPKGKTDEVTIQRGFDDKNPVTLDENSSSGPTIDRGQ